MFADLNPFQLYLPKLKYFSKTWRPFYFLIVLLLQLLLWKTSKSSLNFSFICEAKNYTKILILVCTWPLSAMRVEKKEEFKKECTGSVMVSFNWIFWITEYFKFAKIFIKMITFPTKICRVLFTKLFHSFKIRLLQYLGMILKINSQFGKVWGCRSCFMFWIHFACKF